MVASDFPVFRSPQNVLYKENFSGQDLVKTLMKDFVMLKTAEFYLGGINKLIDL